MLNLMEEFEFSGEWWLPTNEDKRVPGTLRFSQMEGAVLILMGNFHSMLEFNNPIEANVVLGLTTTGKSVTLLRCWQIKTNIGFTNSGSSEYIAGFVIVGAHFSDVEDMKFKRFRVSYSYLDEWVGISGFEIGDDLSKEIDIKYKLPASIDISEIDGVKLGIVFGWQLDSIMRNQTSISVNQNIFVVFNFPKGRGFFEVLDFIGHLENFLTLGIGEYARPIYLQGESENYKRVTGGENIYEPIDILYQYVGIPSPKKNLLDIQMLFSYHDIEDRIGDLIQNWYSKKDLLEPVYSLYFSTLKERQMYINHYFMNLVQGIEIYHRRIIRNEELPPVEHKKRIKEVMKKIPLEHKNWLGGRLNFSNEPGLRKRLVELTDKYLNILSSLIGDPKDFVDKVASTRDYHTHFNEDIMGRAAIKGKDFHELIGPLKIILEASLLESLGFTIKEIEKLFKNKS